MPMKGRGRPRLREIDRWDRGVGWIAYPDEAMQRASHALATDAGIWIVDPVDAPGVDDLVAELGAVAGVAVLLDRHARDAAAIASRHGVPVSLPSWMTGVASSLDAPVERLGDDLGDTGYELRKVVDNRAWQEAVLYGGADGTLYVPEALGTSAYFRAGDERLGVHPMLRLTPPTTLAGLSIDRLLVGHGAGIFDDPETAVETAVETSRRRTPRAYLEALRGIIGI